MRLDGSIDPGRARRDGERPGGSGEDDLGGGPDPENLR
jgi:hypothetical protein